ncbi:F-box protein dre-1 [Colletotrichum musicola]|uniref:F-box protein dre-1 n=1 Tax=Colletotrichum musicola TaxID=2175873 RepID=A0A8H6KGB1_9PEZI|nr:F-box protein dre-1 [Colletotrichum musicola]
MHRKRSLADVGDDALVSKRARFISPQKSRTRISDLILDTMPAFAAEDILSSLSDELLLRILSFLSTSNLLEITPVSRRFYRLSTDSQLWRTLYYHRFVLPRALRIPGIRQGSEQGTRIHNSARRIIWAGSEWCRRATRGKPVDWKRQYKLRYNWARGKATVEELDVGEVSADTAKPRKTLAKVIEGIAVTAGGVSGLRAWDLKTRETIAQISLADGTDNCTPTCLAIDDQNLESKRLDVSVGFLDGSFGIWRLHLEDGRFLRRCKNAESPDGQLIGIAYRHPFVLTATDSILISLYSFEKRPETSSAGRETDTEAVLSAEVESETEAGSESTTLQNSESETEEAPPRRNRPKNNIKPVRTWGTISLPAPVLMTSLKSHTSQAPLALSIREMASFSIASIAYTYASREGWCIGIQDLQIRRQGDSASPSEVVSSRLALTASLAIPSSTSSTSYGDSQHREVLPKSLSDGPKTLCYNHPYLLAALTDNTLVLHVCTSDATKISVSPGIRLWGHTSGISDAEITARGKAVSVSCRGEEIRVWELEGRVSGKSTEIRPNAIPENAACSEAEAAQWDERRNWVGFDDEMVIVLKETKHGRETLVVYDFS